MPLVSKSEALSEGDIRLKISFEENRRAASGEILALGLLLVAATLVASAPALLPGHNLVGHDILFHLNRIEGIKEGLLSGQFPVRLDVNCIRGYGMPTGIFYPSLFVYVPAILRIFGVSQMASWKAFLVMVNFLTMVSSWWAFSKYLRSARTGAIATLFYLVVGYRLIDVYARAAAGEMLSMAFLPAVLLSIWMTLHRNVSYWPAVVLFMTGIFQSHIITGLVIVFTAVLLAAVSYPRLRIAEVRWAVFKAAGMTFLLNIWFYAPLLYFHTHMDYVMKNLVKGSLDGFIRPLKSMDFYLGSAMLILLVIVVLLQVFRKRDRAPWQFWLFVALSAGIAGLTVFPALWRLLGKSAGVLQFPFRLAMFPAVLIPLALAMAFSKVRHLSIVTGLAFLCLCGNLFWLTGNTYRAIPSRFKMPAEQLQVPPGQPSPMFMLDPRDADIEPYMASGDLVYIDYADAAVAPGLHKENWLVRWKVLSNVRSLHPSDRITSVERRGAEFVITYSAGREEQLELPLLWYMGYAAEIDGTPCPVLRDEDAQVSIHLPETAGTLHVWYAGLPWFRMTDAISFVSLLGFCIILYRTGKRSAL